MTTTHSRASFSLCFLSSPASRSAGIRRQQPVSVFPPPRQQPISVMSASSSGSARGGPPHTPPRRGQKARPPQACAHPIPSGAAQQRVRFKNRFGEALSGVYVEPGAMAEEPGVVVLCHGFASTKDWRHFPTMAAELAKRRLASLRFDFSGNGDSEGAFEFGNYAKEVGELRAAVEFVRAELRRAVVGLVGHSKGGNDVLLYTSQFDDVPLVVNLSGRFDTKQGIKERFGADIFDRLNKFNQLEMNQRKQDGSGQFKWLLTKRSMDERLNTDMKAASEKIKLSEVLTIHGASDEIIPVQDAQSFAEIIKPHSLMIIDGADHNFSNPANAQVMIQKVVAFLTSGL